MNVKIVPKVKVISSVQPFFQKLVNDFIADQTKVITDIKINTTSLQNNEPEHHAFIFYDECHREEEAE
ncbi:hypothetical protein [Trichococcus collinsii]|uniref:Uncharacterized protein n=1 Tax=Trichococcus collinsii TaxID=157076 RepID=A0AB37ZXF4_9LACT|nr:hypothetical protein [Trichococcus collinsii]CZR02641.1 Hypothetical protein Tcol_2063 [Trichococcus collinsii]SDZ96008.1 hypothetical protein SAMN04488525_101727 [Trichococcus collinsii]